MFVAQRSVGGVRVTMERVGTQRSRELHHDGQLIFATGDVTASFVDDLRAFGRRVREFGGY
jgi:hypothetical protein